MPELDFYFNDIDERDFLSFVLAQGFTLIPNLPEYSAPAPIELRNLVQFFSYRPRTRTFLLTHPAYTCYPLDFRRYGKETGKNGYYIMPGNGGPSMEYMTSTAADNGAVAQGFIAHYSQYQVGGLDRSIKAPVELKALFRSLTSHIRQHAVRCMGERTFWIGRGALKELKSGKTLVGIDRLKIETLLRLNEGAIPKK